MSGCIGIRQENAYEEERRVPLAPDHVANLVREHRLRVIVEPSAKRCFSDAEYERAGAEVSADLSPCTVVFGVKEIPPQNILPGQVYCAFSHTMAGHPSTMPMLDRILTEKCTLIDYELVRTSHGRRVIFFGHFAGYAGMIDALWALGQRFRWEGVSTPFEDIRPAFEYPSLEAAQAAIKEAGVRIRREGLPPSAVPMVFGFTGQGNVARGAMRILHLLPTVKLHAEELDERFRAGQFSNGTVYSVRFRQRDLYEPLAQGEEFDWSRLHRHPETYRNRFERFLPLLSVLVNGIHWDTGFPRVVTKSGLRALFERNPTPRLRVISDITCDVEGSIEATVKTTPSGRGAAYVYEPLSGVARDGVAGVGPVMVAIDTLPSELPLEASTSFGDALMPFVPTLAGVDYSVERGEDLALPDEIRKAVIVHRGRLTDRFAYLESAVQVAQAVAPVS
jgi:alpha-aminoadipic semialdehyde synthase